MSAETFLHFIDGNGTITFNNASVHADVLKAGVFGTNGVLNIGGGTLSADTTLKLYASGSNGQINFISNVTLGGSSAKILAANSITILNGVVVTVGNISDENPADVYTNHANYSGFGGNDSTPARLLAPARIILSRSIRRRRLELVLPRLPLRRIRRLRVIRRGITHPPNPAVVQGRPPRSVAGAAGGRQ